MTQFSFVKTDTIKAHFAPLPVIDTNMRYLVRVLEPVELIPQTFIISGIAAQGSGGPLEALKDELLEEWHTQFKNQKRALKNASMEWVHTVDKVELIECNLMTPKEF